MRLLKRLGPIDNRTIGEGPDFDPYCERCAPQGRAPNPPAGIPTLAAKADATDAAGKADADESFVIYK